jgi:hypothetical protein
MKNLISIAILISSASASASASAQPQLARQYKLEEPLVASVEFSLGNDTPAGPEDDDLALALRRPHLEVVAWITPSTCVGAKNEGLMLNLDQGRTVRSGKLQFLTSGALMPGLCPMMAMYPAKTKFIVPLSYVTLSVGQTAKIDYRYSEAQFGHGLEKTICIRRVGDQSNIERFEPVDCPAEP